VRSPAPVNSRVGGGPAHLTWSTPVLGDQAEHRLSQAWNATVTATGAAVTARNLSRNGSLAAGGSTSFGFLASWNGANSAPAVTCTLD
jgi:mannan endo-1,4-beta-mannosidase